MIFRAPVDRAKQDQPEEPQGAGEQERRAPRSEQVIDREDDPGRQRAADGRSAVEQRHRPPRLPSREPFGDRLRGPGPVAALAKAERESESGEACQPGRKGRRHGGHRVPQNGQAQAGPGSKPIDGSSGDRLTDGIGDTEGDEDEREVRVGPSILGLQVGTEDAQRLTIDVVDDRREKEQAPDVPAQVSDRPGHMLTGNSSENSCAYPSITHLRWRNNPPPVAQSASPVADHLCIIQHAQPSVSQLSHTCCSERRLQ